MNLAQIKAEIRALAAGETVAAGSHWDATYDSTMLDAWINEGYGVILDSQRWAFLRRESYFTTFYTELAAAKAIGSSTIDVDSAAGVFIGEWIFILHGSTYYPHLVTAINYATKVLSISPPLTVAVSTDDHVLKSDHPLPYNVKCIENLHDQTNLKRLAPKTNEEWAEDYAASRAEGEPDIYCLYANYDFSETGAADAGSSTTQVVDSAIVGKVNDYYNGWLVSGQSRVTDSVYTTTMTLSLETAISGFTTGTNFTIKCDLPLLKISPFPNGAYNVWYSFFARLPQLAEATDAPQFGPDGEKYHRLLVTFGRARAMEESGDPGAGAVMQEFYANLGRMTQDLMFRGRSKARWTFKLKA